MRMPVRGLVAACLLSSLALPARAEFMDMWASREDVGEAKSPVRGKSRVVVIPVEIRNAGFPALDRARLVEFFETESADVLRFPSYWKAASNGRFTVEATVAETITVDGCPKELGSSCSIDAESLETLSTGVELLRSLLRRADEGCVAEADRCDRERAIDFADFDLNGATGAADGVADAVLVVTNLPRVAVTIPVFRLNRAHEDDLAGGHGGPFVLDGVKVPLVSICGVPDAPGSVESACLAEFGHVLGLADMRQAEHYRERRPGLAYAGLQASVVGTWNDAKSAPMPDAESRYRLGWADVEVVSGEKRLTLRPAAQGGGVVKLGMRVDGREEYFLVEARGPVGPYDGQFRSANDGRPVLGLAVYHVDWTRGPSGEPGSWVLKLLDCVNCDPWSSYVMNVQADGRFDVQQGRAFVPEEDLFRAGDALFPSADRAPFTARTHPWGSNWYDGAQSGIEIRNIEVDLEKGWVTADFIAPEVEDACADVACGTGDYCEAGNCLQPPVSPIPERQPPPKAAEPAPTVSAWGCAAAGPSALALLALALLRRRRR